MHANGDGDDDWSNRNQRRIVIGSMLSIPLSLLVPAGPFSIAAAEARSEDKVEKKPFAPLENLLPAVRVKLSIDSAIGLTRSLVAAEGGDEKSSTTTNQSPSSSRNRISQETILAQLENLLLKPQNYVQTLQLQGVPSKPADLYLKSYRSEKGDLPLQKAMVQSGDVDAWKRLKRREKDLERSSEVRAALNAYTDALSFSGDSYVLTVDKSTRSRMVREDRLPDIKQVITSDMGMRYLYRNQVLTAMDDVKAELEYQLKVSSSSSNGGIFYGIDLLDLLGLAGEAMDRWLSLVPPDDVKEALKSVATAEEQ